MRSFRGLWAGLSLLLVLYGCEKESEIVKGRGSYAPIITGIASNFEPVARGGPNQLTVQVTNVNALPLTYHWSVTAGTLTDSTNATATWIAPDSIGTYPVTVSIEANDGVRSFFKTMTVGMLVENEYVRWTRSPEIQFDPAPVPGGGILYSQVRSASVGSSDVYRVPAAEAGGIKLTDGFFTATSPTPRADLSEFAFAGRRRASDLGPSLWLLPWGGGDTTTARVVTARTASQTILRDPRFARRGSRLLYTSDSVSTTFPKPWWRDVSNFGTAPVPVILIVSPQSTRTYAFSNWGPDTDADDDPDSLVVLSFSFFGTTSQTHRGMFKYPTPPGGRIPGEVLWITDPGIEEPDWSPDGLHVVFAKRNPGSNERDLWIISRAATSSSEAIRVTSGPADDSHPRFTEDGTAIVFVSNRADRYGLGGIYGTERRGTNIWSVSRFDRP